MSSSADVIWTLKRRERRAPASFEPTIDYVVTKIPRFAFEKFPQAGVAAFGRKPPFKNLPSLRRSAGTPPRMKSVGEAMAIGRTLKEGEYTRPACRFRRTRRNHFRATPALVSVALTEAREGACGPHCLLEIGRRSVGAESCRDQRRLSPHLCRFAPTQG